MTTVTIRDIVSKTPELPSMPAAAVRVVRACQKSDTSAHQIAEILSADQALSVRVLRLANSAFYGLSRQVSNLQEAVVVLGMRSVKDLAMVAGTYSWLSRPVTGYALGPRQLWCHSFGTAIGAQLAAQASGKCAPDVAFTAGLLHDIGKVALGVWLENKLGGILLYASREGLTFDAAERKILGFDHCQVGAYLANEWNLPEEIVQAARYHHDPDACQPTSAIVDAVHLGNYLTLSLGYGLGGDGLHYEFSEGSLLRMGLRPEQLDAMTSTFVDEYSRYEQLYDELAA